MKRVTARRQRERDCDDCGKKGVEIARVYRAHRYCRTCYSQTFRSRPCPRCGATARLPTHLPKAICDKCERKGPCVRCGRPMGRIGFRTPYGPACNACAPYFREPEPCGSCGVLSKHLARVARLGHALRLCPRCARADHGTCAWCRRYRLLSDSDTGKRLCKRCREEGHLPCPKCGNPMPAGCGNQCWDCYRGRLADKRTKIDRAAFSSRIIAEQFEAFGKWLKETRGPEAAARKIHRFLPFFLEIEREWGAIPAYTELLSHFGAKRLRAVLLAMRWMEETGIVKSDPNEKEINSDKRRIGAAIERFPERSQARAILESYCAVLDKRIEAGRSNVRSVRLATTPAVGLLEEMMRLGRKTPDQRALDAYLKKAPGQRAALAGFVAHLRKVHGATLVLPKRNPRAAQRKRRQKLKRDLLALMRRRKSCPKTDQSWITLGLAYFHDVPMKVAARVRLEDMVQDRGGISVLIANQRYWIPRREAHLFAAGG